MTPVRRSNPGEDLNMAATQAVTVLRHIRGLVTAEQAAGLTDPELLGRFTGAGDETAFAALVRRHGPMVLGVCRRVLHNAHDAEDAFQATFLVLARKATSITRHGSLSCWLYRVAYHTAAKARSLLASRRAHEARAGHASPGDALAEVTGRELVGVLDEELGHLGERFRAPLVLCYLEGKTRDEAARELGWSLGTFKRRLEQARLRLRERLARRGLTLPGTLLVAGICSDGATAAVPGPLADATVRAALAASSTAATAVAALARGTLHAMLAARLRVVAAVALLGCGLVAGAVIWAAPQAPAAGTPKKSEAKASAPQAGAQPDKKEVLVTGRVLDADGKPVKGARVGVMAVPDDWQKRVGDDGERMVVLGQVQTGADGQYQLRAPQPTARDPFLPTMILARAPGHGAGLLPLPTGIRRMADIRLPREQVRRIRFVDLQGQPLAGVKVQVEFVAHAEKKMVGVVQPTAPSSLWFESPVTDAEGRARLTGIGPGTEVGISVRDDRFKPERFRLPSNKAQEIVQILAPAQWVEGRVTYADTGKAVMGGQVSMRGASAVRTGKDGRYRFSPFRDGHGGFVVALPPAGEPYVGAIKQMQDPKASVLRQTADLALHRGVVVRGLVKEAGSGKPVPEAIVYYYPQQFDNPFSRPDATVGPVFPVRSGPDGRFEIVVFAGPGHLVVKGPTPAYIPVAIGRAQLNENKPGGERHYAHGFLRTEFKPDDGPRQVELTVRRGVAVRGRLVGPEGETVTGARMLTRLSTSAPMVIEEVRGVDVPAGGFELPGCDPDKAYPVVFLVEKKGWAARVEVSGKQSGEPLTVRLQRCGSAKVRFLNKEGDPVEGFWPQVEMVFAPGPHKYDSEGTQRGQFAADAVNLANIHRHGYQMDRFRTDAQGRITLERLVPGVTYRIMALPQAVRILREFTVRPGETVDLKDVKIAPN
jgi:RNA polymerase sigma factor (sigma-70 family)